jgi:hypothetical protein
MKAIPDAEIYSHAIGKAAQIVTQHGNANVDLALYSGWFCVSAAGMSCSLY